MRTSREPLRPLTLVLMLAMLFPPSGEATACPEIIADDERTREVLQESLHTLWQGDLQERRRLVHEDYQGLGLLPRILTNPEHELHESVMESVRGLILVEQDDFTLSLLLSLLAHIPTDSLRSVFRDALSHDSPNVRRQAYRWFALNRDAASVEALEDLWGDEKTPWNRSNLMAALACQRSQKHANDVLRIARSEDPGLAAPATEALGPIDDSRVIPLLERLLRSESEAVQAAAVSALAFKSDSGEALTLLADVARNGPDGLRIKAIRELGKIGGDDNARVLLDILGAPGDSRVRTIALSALGTSEHPDFIPTLERFLEEAPSDLSAHFLNSARFMLERARDVERGKVVRKYQHREPQPVCKFETWTGDPNDPHTLAVSPADALESVRCWTSPETAGPPERFRRIKAGSSVFVWGLYEISEQVWLGVSPQGTAGYCWLPRHDLVGPPEREDEADAPEPSEELRIEFDALPTLWEAEAGVELREAGYLERIDPGPGVDGLALEFGLHDQEAVAILLRRFGDAGPVLDQVVMRVVDEVKPAYGEHPELGPRIREVERIWEEREEELWLD